jgi:hypothetical protein
MRHEVRLFIAEFTIRQMLGTDARVFDLPRIRLSKFNGIALDGDDPQPSTERQTCWWTNDGASAAEE